MLTEKDILERRFNRTFRGYDPVEVHYFLEMVNQEFKQMKARIEELEKLEKGFENIAGKNPVTILEEAKERSEKMIQSTEKTIAEVLQKTRDVKDKHIKDILVLKSEKERLLQQMQKIVENEKQIIDLYSEPTEKEDFSKTEVQ